MTERSIAVTSEVQFSGMFFFINGEVTPSRFRRKLAVLLEGVRGLAEFVELYDDKRPLGRLGGRLSR